MEISINEIPKEGISAQDERVKGAKVELAGSEWSHSFDRFLQFEGSTVGTKRYKTVPEDSVLKKVKTGDRLYLELHLMDNDGVKAIVLGNQRSLDEIQAGNTPEVIVRSQTMAEHAANIEKLRSDLEELKKKPEAERTDAEANEVTRLTRITSKANWNPNSGLGVLYKVVGASTPPPNKDAEEAEKINEGQGQE